MAAAAVGRTVAKYIAPLLPPAAWASGIGILLVVVHRQRWGFDLLSPRDWVAAWRAFAEQRLVIDSVDEVMEWGSLPVGAAVALAGGRAVNRVVRRVVAWTRQPIRDNRPLEDDYDLALIETPLPGRSSAKPKIDLPTLNLDDDATRKETEEQSARARDKAKEAVKKHYTPEAPEADPPGGQNRAGGTSDSTGNAASAVSLACSDDARLRIYGTLARLGWSEVASYGQMLATEVAAEESIDILLGGEAWIYVIIVVCIPRGMQAYPSDLAGHWVLRGGEAEVQVPSPVVRARAAANAVDQAVEFAGYDNAPLVRPTVIIAEGTIVGDTVHDVLWDKSEIAVLGEPPGVLRGVDRARSLSTLLGADRPSKPVFDLVGSTLNA